MYKKEQRYKKGKEKNTMLWMKYNMCTHIFDIVYETWIEHCKIQYKV